MQYIPLHATLVFFRTTIQVNQQNITVLWRGGEWEGGDREGKSQARSFIERQDTHKGRGGQKRGLILFFVIVQTVQDGIVSKQAVDQPAAV